ncbi:MAG TPA: RNA polymerase-binding ATPase [Verrucomicrobia bacterium]|nr:RNA polymerase-binding ATPase [Verrucomicrobiales bacterium]HIL55613.1 RNA polymerase-binding ATPase [Verrucomicrobiota bacterium]
MQFFPGQRWISESQPDKGLGLILKTTDETVTVVFPAVDETLTYATGSAPLRRVIFGADDTIELHDGSSLIVEETKESEGLISYIVEGREIGESELSDRIGFHQPDARLLGGRINSSRKFLLRQRTLQARSEMRGRKERGLMGARIDLIPHQLYIADEVSKRHGPRVLLADEVGLGKTIEACLIMHSQLVSGRISRALVLVPEPLIHQWFIELLRRFSLQFAIFDEERCVAIESGGEAENVGLEEKPEKDVNPFLDDQLILASIDLLANDERRASQALDADWDILIVDEAHHLDWSVSEVSNEYKIVEQLASTTDGLLLLTGTPGQLRPEGHFARLKLLDPNRFSDLEKFLIESKDAALVSAIAAKIGTDSEFEDSEKTKLSEWVGGDLPEDSEELLRKLLDLHGTGRVMFRNRRVNLGGFPEREAILCSLETGNEENDPRIDWLINLLENLGEEKVLVICRTVEAAEQLNESILEKVRLKTTLFHEGLELIKRDRSAAYFAEEDGARMLICSEIGSEGRNFQFASNLILYDLPKTPSLLEQRIGRLDRIGQKETVRIYVPFVVGTEHAVLAQWYHQGMDAFQKPIEGGSRLLEQFGEEMERTDPSDSSAWEKITMQTKSAKKDLDEELESGRDRLLEMSSFDQNAAKKIVDDIAAIDQDPTLEILMTDLFDQFGIAIEELGDHCYYIKPDTVFAGDAFPGMREIGMSITFDRSTAMSNEQMTFISWDHPLVSTCIDLMLDGEQGSSSFGQILGTAAQAGLVAECTFLLEPVCPVSLGADRFLPPTPIPVVVDHDGNDIKPNFEDTKVREGNRKWLRSKVEILKRMVPIMREAAEKLAEKDAVKNRKVAAKKMEKALEDTIDRLERLKRLGHPVRESEITAAQNERDALRVHLAQSRLRLDSIRLSAVGA